jgi:hypothetical protein
LVILITLLNSLFEITPSSLSFKTQPWTLVPLSRWHLTTFLWAMKTKDYFVWS